MGLWVTPKGSIDRASPGTGSSPHREGTGGAEQGDAHQWDRALVLVPSLGLLAV